MHSIRPARKKNPAICIQNGEKISANGKFQSKNWKKLDRIGLHYKDRWKNWIDSLFSIQNGEKISANGEFQSKNWKKLDRIGLHYKDRWKNWIDSLFSIQNGEKILANGEFQSNQRKKLDRIGKYYELRSSKGDSHFGVINRPIWAKRTFIFSKK
ncbi:MAG: hypothetical protein H6632_18955 [Anaerolineales bacterium]|nr:hypothetical protein [Anaerolineales bacterium]